MLPVAYSPGRDILRPDEPLLKPLGKEPLHHMERMKASEFPQELLNLFDYYVHSTLR